MFRGFTKQTSRFMWDLAFNNERPWFNEHKQEFEALVMTPFKELARDTYDEMQRRYPELGLELHVSRIYRDARRLHGKGPYKDHLWFSLKNWEGLLQGPMFWFEIGAADYSYGMGFYSATASQMASFRAGVDANPARLERLAKMVEGQEEFRLDGEEYRRPKGDVGELLNPWYNRKCLGLECRRDFGGEALKPTLPRKLADSFGFLVPFYEFFMELCPREG